MAVDSVGCPACGEPDTRQVFAVRTPYLDRGEVYEIRSCCDCGHGFALGRSDDAFLRRIYGSAFHDSSQQRAVEPNAPVNVNARRRVQWLASMGMTGRLLDVGAGNGAFVKAASAHFDAHGLELSDTAAATARAAGLNVVQGDFFTAPLPVRAFDVIAFWDVLASLRDPRRAMARCRELLRPGGHVICTLPMFDGLMSRLLGRFWPLLIPPVNLHYFTRVSAQRVGQAEGFATTLLKPEGKRVSLRFVAQKGLRSLGCMRAESWLPKLVPDVPVYLNTRDICAAVFRLDAEPVP